MEPIERFLGFNGRRRIALKTRPLFRDPTNRGIKKQDPANKRDRSENKEKEAANNGAAEL